MPFDGFRIARQAGSGTGVYCTLYRKINGQMVKATETLKHLTIDESGAWIAFDRKYRVGTAA